LIDLLFYGALYGYKWAGGYKKKKAIREGCVYVIWEGNPWGLRLRGLGRQPVREGNPWGMAIREGRQSDGQPVREGNPWGLR